MDRKKQIEVLVYIILIVALFVPRAIAVDSFATLDEPYWLSMGANFYYALGQREFQNTVYEYQPAVTTMWIVTAAMLFYFPQYRSLGQGYLEYEKGMLDPFMLKHGMSPLELLRDARLIQVVVIVILFLLLYYLLQRLIPKPIVFFAVLFAAFDPYFLGMSRLLNHEAMLSLFVIVSVLAFLIYFSQGRKTIFLLISGVAAGLAQLTKSSAIVVLMPIGVVLLMQVIEQWRDGFSKAVWNPAKVFLIWLFVLVGTYIVFWPGMWVAPGKMLYQVYGNAFSYTFQGARLTVTENLDTSEFNLDTNVSGFVELFKVILWRTTPLTWLGVLLGFSLPFTRDRELVRPNRQLFTLLLVTAAAFILMFGIAQGRNSPHYLLACYLALNLLAGLGWFHAIKWVARRITAYSGQIQYAGLTLLILAQAWSALSFYPYYYSYRNPILYAAGWYTKYPQKPYGEGLELAAQYLSGLPNAKDSTTLVYYARACFSYFYPGETTRFKPYYADAGHEKELVSAITSADYLVLYYANQGKMERYARLFDALSAVTPLHEIWMDGYKYVVIYKVDEIPQTVFEALEK
jgi:4-amino-4-deoxy-L-arabinose transferase-like glycosyltransferase